MKGGGLGCSIVVGLFLSLVGFRPRSGEAALLSSFLSSLLLLR